MFVVVPDYIHKPASVSYEWADAVVQISSASPAPAPVVSAELAGAASPSIPMMNKYFNGDFVRL